MNLLFPCSLLATNLTWWLGGRYGSTRMLLILPDISILRVSCNRCPKFSRVLWKWSQVNINHQRYVYYLLTRTLYSSSRPDLRLQQWSQSIQATTAFLSSPTPAPPRIYLCVSLKTIPSSVFRAMHSNSPICGVQSALYAVALHSCQRCLPLKGYYERRDLSELFQQTAKNHRRSWIGGKIPFIKEHIVTVADPQVVSAHIFEPREFRASLWRSQSFMMTSHRNAPLDQLTLLYCHLAFYELSHRSFWSDIPPKSFRLTIEHLKTPLVHQSSTKTFPSRVTSIISTTIWLVRCLLPHDNACVGWRRKMANRHRCRRDHICLPVYGRKVRCGCWL